MNSTSVYKPLAIVILSLPALLLAPAAADDNKPSGNPHRSSPTPTHAAPAQRSAPENRPTHTAPARNSSPDRPVRPDRTERPDRTARQPNTERTAPAGSTHGNEPRETHRPAPGGLTPTYPNARTPQGSQPAPAGGRNLPSGTSSYPRRTSPADANQPPASPRGRTPQNNPPAGNTGRTFGSGGRTPVSNSGSGRTFGRQQPFHPPAGANMTRRSDGGSTYSHNGINYNTDRSGRLTSLSRPGMQAHFGANGYVRSAHFERPGGVQMNVRHGYYGERHIETIRADRSRVVSYGPRMGYVERPLLRPGYVSRTYIYSGRTYVSVYRTYNYRGVAFYGYVPPVYYHPRFYGWAYDPWPRPIVYGWGWRAHPWFGFYLGFFQPAPVYPTASLWLTDYLIAENLRLAYENRQLLAQQQQQQQYYEPPPPAPADPNGSAALSPAVKQAIAEEVRQQIEAERAAGGQPAPPANMAPASQQAPPVLDPRQRIFVVSSSFAMNASGQECGLTPGDIIVRTADTMTPDGRVSVSVLSSKPGDCPMNSAADLDVASLQEMQNQFQQQVDTGLKTLADNRGQNGLPAGPPPDARPSPDGQAPPDSAASVETALQQQQQDAGEALQQVEQTPGAN